jgi:uncharacterized membrane protein YjjB (DUF3815 family)
MFCSLGLSQRPHSPPAAALLQPGLWLLIPGSLGLLGVTQLIGADSSAAVTITLISRISIALGIQAELLIWRAGRQLHSVIRRVDACPEVGAGAAMLSR